MLAGVSWVGLSAAVGLRPAIPGQIQPSDTSGRSATVVLHDGQVITGILVEESKDSITLLINGIRTTIDARRIRESYIQPPIEERYKAVRATIEDDDSEQLLQLARWLIEKGRSDLALPELEGVLRYEPYNELAKKLHTIAQQNLKLLETRGDDGARTDDNPDEPRTHRPETDEQFPLLSDEDINIMRVWEIDLNDPPRLTIDRSTIEAVLVKFADHPKVPETAAGRAALLSAEPIDQLRFLFDIRARDYYDQVSVLEDPKSIKLFRESVYRTWLRNSCATARCHGGPNAGRLRLPIGKSMQPNLYYTDLLILERYRTDSGLPLINFQAPAESLLLKMGLPRRETSTPHPEARGWRPVFRGVNDRNYRRAVEWITSMWTPRPDYGIDYDPPTALTPDAEAADDGR